MKITRRQLSHLIEQVVGYEPPHKEKDNIVSSGIVGDTVDSDSIESQEAKDSSIRQLTQKRQEELDDGETVGAETTGQQLQNLTQEVRAITRKQLRKIIKEQLALNDFVVIPDSEPRDFGYGEGEGRMSKSQLDKIARYAQSLHDKLLDDDDLPEWVQSKIAVAAEDIGKVYHYLEYKMKRMEQEGDS